MLNMKYFSDMRSPNVINVTDLYLIWIKRLFRPFLDKMFSCA